MELYQQLAPTTSFLEGNLRYSLSSREVHLLLLKVWRDLRGRAVRILMTQLEF